MIKFEMTIRNPDKLTEVFIFSIDTHDKDRKIWIARLDGEGGQFSVAGLYEAIDKFYRDNF